MLQSVNNVCDNTDSIAKSSNIVMGKYSSDYISVEHNQVYQATKGNYINNTLCTHVTYDQEYCRTSM